MLAQEELRRKHLTVPTIALKYDRLYRARDRDSQVSYEVNVARLECSCPDWSVNRYHLPPNDVRRICEHLKDSRIGYIEKEWPLMLQLYIRYGRTMIDVSMVEDERGFLAIGRPFAPHYVRAIGVMGEKPVVVTFNVEKDDWSDRERTPDPDVAEYAIAHMRAALREVFATRGGPVQRQRTEGFLSKIFGGTKRRTEEEP